MSTATSSCSKFIQMSCAICWQTGKLQAEQFPSPSLVQAVGMDGDTGHFLWIRDQLAETLRAT